MPVRGMNARLKALEDVYRRDRIMVLGQLPNGTKQSMTVDEMLEQGAGFCKVLSGSDLKDMDAILDSIAAQGSVIK